MTETGKWYWHELMTSDADAAKQFYGDLLGWGWRTQNMGEMGDYHLVQMDDKDHGGLMKLPADVAASGAPPHWMVYIGVDDINASCAKVAELGGKVLHGPFPVPNVGELAVISDPQGAVFSIMQPAPSSD